LLYNCFGHFDVFHTCLNPPFLRFFRQKNILQKDADLSKFFIPKSYLKILGNVEENIP